MSDPEWADLADAPLIADEGWAYSLNGDGPHDASGIRIVSFGDFISTEEPTAEALLGSKQETILPADGMLLMYGDGGAGKTTLTIDAVAHLGSGSRWLDVDVERPVKCTVIENEGPRGKFRQMLGEKASSWEGADFGANVHVLEEPWTRFSLKDEAHRTGLAEHITQTNTDVVVMGPLATLGMVGGGTPDEINAFEFLLRALRGLLDRAVAFWIVHHENKAGDVSGAWERVPDTLCHVQAAGNGHTLLNWRKARWSSEKHGTSMELVWGEGRSFSTVEKAERDPWEEMLTAFNHADQWRTLKESAKLISISEADAKRVLEQLTRRGEMVFEIGPHGRHGSAHCWRLKGALEPLAHLSAPSVAGASEGALGEPPFSVREGVPSAGAPRTSQRSADTPSAPDELNPLDDFVETCTSCGKLFRRGTGNKGTRCSECV